jgi:transposase
MSLRRHRTEKQSSLWIAHEDLARSPGHPFYEALNRVLAAHDFDRFAEDLCAPHYKEGGRPGIPPGVYFRMIFIGYFEGISSERGIAWRCGDSLSLRDFLGTPLGETTPDHSSMTRIRQRLSLEVQIEIFQFVLKVLAEEKLLSGKTLGVDATTLEANAAMRSIVRKDTGESYTEFLNELARESGIETPTKQELAKVDKQRKNKASNDDWRSPSDPDSGITKMKDGSTHLAHKAEHAVDLETGAVVAVDLSPGHTSDPESLNSTLAVADANLAAVHLEHETVPEQVTEAVADKGYHNNATLVELAKDGTRSYVSDPDRGRRNWQGRKDAQAATSANRSRIRGARGKRLLKLRAERVERSFAHIYDTGGMRRCWLRGTVNILKRLLVHVAAFNLGLIMRKLVGKGTPRGLAEAAKALCSHSFALMNAPRVLPVLSGSSFQQKHGFSFHLRRFCFQPAVSIAA